ncbi:MAG: PH domain-containing protein [Phycisphaerae bacterium]|jgi:hypothetical protein|nr:PH domain-containing protein [Phycisphaerae bacterium]
MTPSASQPVSVSREAALQHLLGEGELVLLTVKPSAWFVPLTSVRMLAILALAAVGGRYLGRVLPLGFAPQTIELTCGLLALGRLAAACCQWAGTLYVLTNRRVLRIRGAIKVTIVGCSLTDIRQTAMLTTGLIERVGGIGTLFFQTDRGNLTGGEWLHISRPAEILETIDKAISQAI